MSAAAKLSAAAPTAPGWGRVVICRCRILLGCPCPCAS